MKQQLERMVRDAIAGLAVDSGVDLPADLDTRIERTRDAQHGDFTSNAAMAMARYFSRSSRALAEDIVARLGQLPRVDAIEVAGPGFINFRLSATAHVHIVAEILKLGENFGQSRLGAGTRILLEFVSANPTGPLHVGHGRGAAFGDALARVLAFAGFNVKTEYYVNDAGRQIDILAASIWLRYLERCGAEFSFPPNAYRGNYILDIAAQLVERAGRKYLKPLDGLFDASWSKLESEEQLDRLIAFAKEILGSELYREVLQFGLHDILDDIRKDLEEFGVTFDTWFSEQSLTDESLTDACIGQLKQNNLLYEKDGALWFPSSKYGDEKDRVVIRENGQSTYFASDIAYHLHKFERGFARLIDIWGADHHGYIARVKAALAALNRDPDAFEVLTVQFATLYRGKERLQMSTRSGEFVTLRELRNEVGNDAARFFYVTRRSDQHLDFDLELAKSRSNENPVYYIQYAHARICSVMQQLKEKGLASDTAAGTELELLVEQHERSLCSTLSRFPDVIVQAASGNEPHLVGYYLRDLANDFHTYYNSHQFLVDDTGLRDARISLILAVRQVIRNGLLILGVSAPEMM